MSLMLPPSQLKGAHFEPAAGERLEDFLPGAGLPVARAAVVQRTSAILRQVARGRHPREFVEFARQVRLVGVAVQRGDLAERCAGCCGETRHDSVEAAYALVVLGREPDRRAEQRGEVPRAVTRRALQARDRGRRGRGGGGGWG